MAMFNKNRLHLSMTKSDIKLFFDVFDTIWTLNGFELIVLL